MTGHDLPPQATRLEFRGKAKEYFGIWIVNLLLTIITVGFYSPWAKVRTLRYFYNNTLLGNTGFDYTAQPWAIFRGRLIAFAVFVTYSFAANTMPALNFVLLGALFLATPWLVVRALTFNRHNTVYRNLRFSFASDYRSAAETYLAAPLLGIATLGLFLPYASYRAFKFKIGNTAYGQSTFSFKASFGQFYRAILKGVLTSSLILVPMLLVVVVSAIYFLDADTLAKLPHQQQNGGTAPSPAIMLAVIVSYMSLFFFGYVYYHVVNAYVTNLALSNTTLNDIQFQSSLNPWRITWIALSNAIAMVLSLGLLHPWASIRMARYRTSKLSVTAPTGFDLFVAGQSLAGTATGEELADLFDVDIAL